MSKFIYVVFFIFFMIHVIPGLAEQYYIVRIEWTQRPDIHEINHKVCTYGRSDVYLHGSVGWGGWTNPRFGFYSDGNLMTLLVDLTSNTTKTRRGWITTFLINTNTTGTYVYVNGTWKKICTTEPVGLPPGSYYLDPYAHAQVRTVPAQDRDSQINNKITFLAVFMWLIILAALTTLLASTQR